MDAEKKAYATPSIQSESAFEVLASGCTLQNPDDDWACDPVMGGFRYTT